MSDEIVFREVDEALRRDRMQSAWRRYGPYVIGAAVAIVLLVAANEGWNWWQSTNAARSSDQFYAALDLENGGDLAGAQKSLDALIEQGSGQYPVLAKFKQAGLLYRQGDKDKALAAYDALATNAGNQRLKETALLLAANVLVDKGDVPGVKQRVDGLLAPDSPMRNAARETLGLAQFKAGDLNGARDSFEAAINDPLSSNEARQRLQWYVSQLIALGATPPAGVTTATNPTDAAAAAVQAIGAGGTPAAANDNSGGNAPATGAAGGTDTGVPAGVESAQPATPDSSLELAVPPAASTGAPAAEPAPTLSTGAGLPTVTPDAAPGAAPAAAPDATATTPATTAPATGAAPASGAAPATGTAPAAGTTPAPATGTSGQ